MVLIAVDHGNDSIKSINFSFKSGLTEHTVKPPLASEVIEFDGKIWTLSSQRISYMRDKTRDERFFVLTLFAIAKELTLAGEFSPFAQINLAIGLPPEHFSLLRKKFTDYFRRENLQFVYNDHPIRLGIGNVSVFPQAYAAVAPNGKMLLEAPRLFVIDIGGYTTDVLLLCKGVPDLRFCRSLETGVITFYNDIAAKVNTLHDMLIEDEHILAVMQGEKTALPQDVIGTITSAARQHADNILDKLRELQVDLRSNPAIFVGGGSVLFKRYLENSPLVLNGEFELDPKANAIGYKLLALAQFRKSSV